MFKVILLLLISALPVLAQENTGRDIYKSTGETVTLTWEWDYEDVASELANWAICRQAGTSGQTTCVTVAKEARQFVWPMPGGSVKEYRLKVYAQGVDGILSLAGDELVVQRK